MSDYGCEVVDGKIDRLREDVQALIQGLHKLLPALGHQSVMLSKILEAVSQDDAEESPLAEALRAILGVCKMSADRLGRIEDRLARIERAVGRPMLDS